ncbi:type II and III secretion system protein [Magnetovibrio sp. PR-2]|uniref:type II and III secretion system protein n=1 Tax=Magnetovibrio sp. PR-2 TaxID=3120356 RepID=UPI002FCE3912
MTKNSNMLGCALPVKIAGAFLMATMLSSCQTTDLFAAMEAPGKTSEVSQASFASMVDMRTVNTEPRKHALKGLEALEDGDLEDAQYNFNLAVKMDIRNSHLQFLNALTYHLQALNGRAEMFELAQTGYKLAEQFGPTNWMVPFYEGLLFKDMKNFGQAQDSFARALLLNRTNPDTLYHLAEASYYARDIETASSALRQLSQLDLSEEELGRMAEVYAIVSAGENKPAQATVYLDTYLDKGGDERRAKFIKRRMQEWTDFHQRAQNRKNLKLAQFSFDEPAEPPAPSPSPASPVESSPFGGFGGDSFTSPAAQEVESEENELQNAMVAVDVVIIRTEDDNSTSKGVNLLSGLKVQFGDPLSGTAAIGYDYFKKSDYIDTTNTDYTRAITRSISIPSVTYSLNIANAQDGRNEILARPTLVAMSGETSEFFSGMQVAAAAVSSGEGDSVSVDKEIGVKLGITPEILDDGYVRLDVEAERTFLTQPSSSVSFTYRLDTTKTNVNAAVSMKFGQTLILGGLSERERENDRDGVPFLQDIPIVQYLFSKQTTRDFNKSVLILITPRRSLPVDQSPEEFEKTISKFTENERTIERLSYEFRDWFQPRPNVDSIFKHMQGNDLYREFREGDFPMESWRGKKGHIQRLFSVLEYLYY